MGKAREFQKNIYFCFIDYVKALTVRIKITCGKFFTRPPDLPLEKTVCRSGSNSQNWTWNNRLVPNRKKKRKEKKRKKKVQITMENVDYIKKKKRKRSTSRLYIVTLLI